LLLVYALKYAQMMCNIQKQIRDVSKGLITTDEHVDLA